MIHGVDPWVVGAQDAFGICSVNGAWALLELPIDTWRCSWLWRRGSEHCVEHEIWRATLGVYDHVFSGCTLQKPLGLVRGYRRIFASNESQGARHMRACHRCSAH